MFIYRRIIHIILYSVLAAILISCSKEEDINIEKPELAEGRTMLVYMVADNNLYSDAERNLEQIKNGLLSLNNKNDIFVYFDGEPYRWSSKPTLRKINCIDDIVLTDTIAEYNEGNSASKERFSIVLSDFVKHKGNTKSAGLLLWSHGSGWLPPCYPNCPDNRLSRSFGVDEIESETGISPRIQSLDIIEMADVIPANHFDFIVFDACLMQSIEVAYQLRHKVDYILAGSSLTPATGLPYNKLPSLFLGENINYMEAIKTICDEYRINEATDGGASFSLVKTSSLEDLAKTTNIVVKKYSIEQRNATPSEYLQGFDHAYGRPLFYDYFDYISSFANKDEMNLIKAALKESVLYAKSTNTVLSGSAFSRYPRRMEIRTYSGLSINRYGNELDWYYQQLDWYKAVYQN